MLFDTALVSPDMISQDPQQDLPECLTEYLPNDLPTNVDRLQAPIKWNQAFTVNLLASSSQSDMSLPSSRSPRSSATTLGAKDYLDSHVAGQLFDLVNNRGQTSEPSRMASANEDKEGAGFHPSKRIRVLSSYSQKQVLAALFLRIIIANYS